MTRLGRRQRYLRTARKRRFPGIAYSPNVERRWKHRGSNPAKPCRGTPFGLYGDLESESQNGNICLLLMLSDHTRHAVACDRAFSAAGLVPRAVAALSRPWVLALLWLAVFAYVARFVLFVLPVPPKFSDFNHFYMGALSLRLGSNPYIVKYDALAHAMGVDIGPNHISNQPPTFMLCLEPLTSLTPLTAYRIWIGFCFMSFVSAIGLLLVGNTSLAPPQMLLLCALTFIYPPVYELFYFANTQTVILLLIVTAMCCLRRGWNSWAGISLALATALKAYPWVLAVYLGCRRQWHALLWMVIAGALIGTLTIWFMGWATFLSSVDTWSFTNSRFFLGHPDDLALNAFVSRLFWSMEGVPATHGVEIIRSATAATVELALFALTVAATIGSGPDRGWRALSLWVVAMILLSPTARGHYLILSLVLFAAIAEAARRGEAAPRVICGAVASYLLAFSNYPLSLLLYYHWGGAAFFRIAGEYEMAAAVMAYLTAYWFTSSAWGSATEARSAGMAVMEPSELDR
jgi:Glycosyltransferase family 87